MHRTLFYLIFSLFFTIFAHGPVDDLIKVKSKEISQQPQNARLYLERALLNEQHEDWDACEKDLLQARKLKNDLTDFDYFLGRIKLAQANDLKAIDYFDKSLKHKPHNFEILFDKGRAYFSLKKYALAAQAFDLAFKHPDNLQPNHVIERVQAHQLGNTSNFQEINQAIQQGLDKFGPVLILQIEQYQLCKKHKQFSKGLLVLDEILKNVSRKEKWLIEKARCYIFLNQFKEAKNALIKAEAIFADMPASIKKRKIVAVLIQDYEKLSNTLKIKN